MTDTWIALCHIDQIPDNSSRGFDLTEPPIGLLIVRKQGKIHIYQNHCPHRGIRLEWVPDQFLDIHGYYIQCATHGALFNIADGLCIAGPCSGQSLQPVTSEIRNQIVGILLPMPS